MAKARAHEAPIALPVSLRQWDAAGRMTRTRILREVLALQSRKKGNSPVEASSLDNALGPGAASLFLARTNTWMRMTCLTGYELTVQLQVCGMFLESVGGERFVNEFVECGGITTLLDVLALPGPSDAEKVLALSQVKLIAERGWETCRIINEQDGAAVAMAYMLGSATEPGQVLISSLLVELANNDVRYRHTILEELLDATASTNPFAQLAAANAVRQLLVTTEDGVEPKSVLQKAAIAAANLVAAKQFKLERVANELLDEVLHIQDGYVAIAESLANALVDINSDDAAEFVLPSPPQPSPTSHASPRDYDNDEDEVDEMLAAHKLDMRRRAAAATLLARHVVKVYEARNREAIELLQSDNTVRDVLSCMASLDLDTKKAANNCLCEMYNYARTTMQELMRNVVGEAFLDYWIAHKDMGVSEFLTKIPDEHKDTLATIARDRRESYANAGASVTA